MNEITTRILKGLLLVFAVVMVFSIVYHLLFQSYETENAVYYEVSDVSAFQGVYIRSETVDFQPGEVEWRGGNLYYDHWHSHLTVHGVTPVAHLIK